MLDKLPICLKTEILAYIYQYPISLSKFFKLKKWENDPIIRNSILRFIRIEIFMPQDLIIAAGDV